MFCIERVWTCVACGSALEDCRDDLGSATPECCGAPSIIFAAPNGPGPYRWACQYCTVRVDPPDSWYPNLSRIKIERSHRKGAGMVNVVGGTLEKVLVEREVRAPGGDEEGGSGGETPPYVVVLAVFVAVLAVFGCFWLL